MKGQFGKFHFLQYFDPVYYGAANFDQMCADIPACCPPEVSDRSSVGVDTTLGFSRSFVSEANITPVIGQKVTENLSTRQADAFSEYDEADDSSRQSSPAPISPDRREIVPQIAAAPEITTRREENGGEMVIRLRREKQIEREKKSAEKKLQGVSPDEMAGERSDTGEGSGGGAPGSPGGQRASRETNEGDAALSDDADSFSMIGFFLYQWNRLPGVSLSRVTKALLCCIVGSLILYHIYPGGGILFEWMKPNPDFTYIPPVDAPRDMNELIERVHTVEKELGSFGQFVSSFESKYREVLENEVGMLKHTLESTAFDSASSQNELRAEIASLSKTLETVKRLQDAIKDDAKKKLATLYEAQGKLDKELADFRALQKVRNDAIEAFEKALPKQMVATLRPNGDFQLSEKFQKSLQDIFEKIFPRHFKDAMDDAKLAGFDKIPSWEAFLQDNEHKLHELIEQHTPGGLAEEGDGTPGGVVLSKATVMLVIQEEAEKYHKKWEMETFLPNFESKFANQLEELQNQIRRENTVHFSSVSSSILAAASAVASDAAEYAARNAASSPRRPSEGRFERISQGSKELLATLPDYASLLVGASVWPYVTSPTYKRTSGQGFIYFLYSVFGRGPRVLPPPALAISPSTEVGECWPFPEGSGDIGIKLSEPIYVSHVTVDHVSKQQAIDISSAPKNMEFWIKVPDAAAKNELESALPEPPGQWYRDGHTAEQTGGEWVRVHTFMYDIHSDSAAQTVQLPIDLERLGISSRIVAFRILDNWGQPSYTCLYRVRVHGYPAEDVSARGDEEEGGK